jgi:hypothetical protein
VTDRRALAVAAVAVAALLASACGREEPEPCTQADLDRPAPTGMPVPARITQTRRLNGDRLDPLPAGFAPSVDAHRAWPRLRHVRQAGGGGHDELLLGLFSGRGYSKVPAWVLFTSHVAQRLDPLALPPGVKARDEANPCAFVDVLTVLNASTGERFYGSTVTSAGPARGRLPARTRPEPDGDT